MAGPRRPANSTSAATDSVDRVQVLDSSGNIVSSFSGGGGTTGTPADAFASPGAISENQSFPMGFNGTTWDRVRVGNQDGLASLLGLLGVVPYMNSGNTARSLTSVQNGDGGSLANVLLAGMGGMTGSNQISAQRLPNVFKSFASTAITAGTGATVWTPAAGKKFRLMGWAISSSVAGVLIFGDNLVGTVIARSPALAAAGIAQVGAADMGIGILSAAANNVLKLDGPTGNVAGMVWGTEE